MIGFWGVGVAIEAYKIPEGGREEAHIHQVTFNWQRGIVK